MSVSFERRNDELILFYFPAMGISEITKRLSMDEEILIKRTFLVTKSMLREPDKDEYDFEDTLMFCIGQVGIEYTQIYPEVISTEHQFYFSNDINSIFAKGGYTDKEAERNILSNPFKRFEDMQMLRHTKTLGIVQVDESVWKRLSAEEKAEIERTCNEKMESYYTRQK